MPCTSSEGSFNRVQLWHAKYCAEMQPLLVIFLKACPKTSIVRFLFTNVNRNTIFSRAHLLQDFFHFSCRFQTTVTRNRKVTKKPTPDRHNIHTRTSIRTWDPHALSFVRNSFDYGCSSVRLILGDVHK